MSHLEQITIDKEKQEAILDQALRLFMRHGVKSMTMDDVANHLRISKKTLYQFVTDKNDLVERAVMRMHTGHTAVIDGICAQGLNAIDEQYEVAKYLAGLLSQVPSLDPLRPGEIPSEGVGALPQPETSHIDQCLTRNMHKGIKEGLYREDLKVDIVSKLYMARFDVLFDGELFPMDRYSFADITWESFRYHIHGIASPKGVQYLLKKIKRERTTA
jgi:AcrR family transcriptional regulator